MNTLLTLLSLWLSLPGWLPYGYPLTPFRLLLIYPTRPALQKDAISLFELSVLSPGHPPHECPLYPTCGPTYCIPIYFSKETPLFPCSDTLYQVVPHHGHGQPPQPTLAPMLHTRLRLLCFLGSVTPTQITHTQIFLTTFGLQQLHSRSPPALRCPPYLAQALIPTFGQCGSLPLVAESPTMFCFRTELFRQDWVV